MLWQAGSWGGSKASRGNTSDSSPMKVWGNPGVSDVSAGVGRQRHVTPGPGPRRSLPGQHRRGETGYCQGPTERGGGNRDLTQPGASVFVAVLCATMGAFPTTMTVIDVVVAVARGTAGAVPLLVVLASCGFLGFRKCHTITSLVRRAGRFGRVWRDLNPHSR